MIFFLGVYNKSHNLIHLSNTAKFAFDVNFESLLNILTFNVQRKMIPLSDARPQLFYKNKEHVSKVQQSVANIAF